MKHHYIILSIFLSFCFLAMNCSSDKEAMNAVTKYPLKSFVVKVGSVCYHGKIDPWTKMISIGSIENPNTITDVEYQLMDEKTTLSPDPKVFLGKWEKNQEVKVTTDDGDETIYTISLTDYDEKQTELLFFDDFEVDGKLNDSKWIYGYFEDTPDGGTKVVYNSDYAYVENGNLVLKADKVENTYRKGRAQTSGGKFDFTFGKVEVRARITRHPDGNFPAIWMMPEKCIYPPSGINTNPVSGEIDIMEHVKQENGIYSTVHSNYTYNLGIKDPNNSVFVECDYENYNLYGMEWNENEIIFSVNGIETLRYPNLHLPNESEAWQWPFSKDSSFYLILNMNLGKAGSWVGDIDDAGLPAIMEVDYVKVTKTN